MRSAFLGPAYALRSSTLSAQTCINLYPEQLEGVQGGEIGGYYNTPGLRRLVTVGDGPIRGCKVSAGYLWVVSGVEVYRVASDWTASLLGTIPSSRGRVSMESNGIEVIIAHADGWHRINMLDSAFSQVTDPDCPRNARIAHQDTYILFTKEDGTFGWTSPGDATSIDALDFASAEGSYDYILNIISDHREVWLFGENSTEVWFNAGDADQPFQRSGNAYIEHGIAAPDSAAKMDNTVFWLSRDDRGQGVVYRANGYTPQRISTYAVEYAISKYGDISDAFAYTYQQAGHHFYVLTFPTASATWVFDVNSSTWHQRAYRNLTNGRLERHRSNTYAFFGGQHVVGDYEDGRLYALDLDCYTDDGDPKVWERAWVQIEAERHWIRHESLELVAEMGVGLDGLAITEDAYLVDEFGVPILDEFGEPIRDPGSETSTALTGYDPLVLLDWSDDGGRTWSNTRELKLGRIGAFRNRAFTRRLGLSRNRIYRLRGSDPVKTSLLGVNINMRALDK